MVLAAPRCSALRLIRRAVAASFSKKVTRSAPRDKASKPNAPVPANTSSTCTSVRGAPLLVSRPWVSLLKIASRTRSAVGRKVLPGAVSSLRPR